MLKRLLYKKEYLLPAAAILLLLLSYQLAFRQTLTAWQLNHQLKQQLAQQTDLSFQPGYKERKNANLEKIIGRYRADTLEFRSRILGEISEIAEKENVKLAEVPARDPLYKSPSKIIQRLNFEGDYFSLTKTVAALQKAQGLGIIRSFVFRTPKNNKRKEKVTDLTLEMYFVNLDKELYIK